MPRFRRLLMTTVGALGLGLVATLAAAQDRLPPIPADKVTRRTEGVR